MAYQILTLASSLRPNRSPGFLLSALAFLALSPNAPAQTNNPTGIGIGLGLGLSSIEDEDAPGDTFDGSDFGWNLDIEWRFVEYVAVGLNWTSLGEDTEDFNAAQTTIGVDGFGAYVRGYWPVTANVTLHARYGETNYSVDIDPGIGSIFPFSDDAKDFGIGGDYYVNENLAVRVEARWLDGPDKEAGGLTTIGLRWQF